MFSKIQSIIKCIILLKSICYMSYIYCYFYIKMELLFIYDLSMEINFLHIIFCYQLLIQFQPDFYNFRFLQFLHIIYLIIEIISKNK